MNASSWRRLLYVAIGIAAALALYFFAMKIPRTLTIFVIAAFIAFGVQPVINMLERRNVPKIYAIAIVFAVLTIVIVLALFVLVPLTIAQLQAIVVATPDYVSTLQLWLHDAQSWLEHHIPGLHVPADTFDLGTFGSQRLSAMASDTLTSAAAIIVGAATAFFVAFSSIVLSFFFLLNDSQIVEGFASLFPQGRRETARKLAREITETFSSYIAGQILVSAITGIVVAVASAIVGFKLWLVLGLLTFVGYSVPVIGMLIVQAIALVLCAPQGGWTILWVEVILFVMARISDNVLVPKIMGGHVGVSPIGVMFAVFAGGELFGIPGLLLGIPVAALIKILWRYFVAPWLHARLDKA